jgi:hypothetical protein
MCGWVQGCHTADVDALLFGAVTVFRTLSLHTAQQRNTQMARCRRSAVQRVLQLRQGGTQVGQQASERCSWGAAGGSFPPPLAFGPQISTALPAHTPPSRR